MEPERIELSAGERDRLKVLRAQLDGSASEEAVHHRSHRIMARLRKAASRLRSHALR